VDIIFVVSAFQSKDASCVASVDADAFILQLEKEMEATKHTMKWEKEFEEHQADGKVCLECRKYICGTEAHEHMVYDSQDVLRSTKRKENGFHKMIKDHKRDRANIENSLAEQQKDKELVEKKLQMCNTGIFALAEIHKKVSQEPKNSLTLHQYKTCIKFRSTKGNFK